MTHFYKWKFCSLSFIFPVIFTINTLTAQIELGPMVGWQWSNLKFNSEIEQDNTIGYKSYFLGVSAKGSIGNHLNLLFSGQYMDSGYRTNAMVQLYPSLRPGTLIVLPDGRAISSIDQGSRNLAYRHQYLEMSTGFDYSFTPEFSTGIGTYLGFRQSEITGLSDSGEEEYTMVNASDKFRDGPIDFGLSANMKIYIKRLYIIFRYQYGLNSISRDGQTFIVQRDVRPMKQRRRNLSIGLGYYFTVLTKH